MSNLHSIVSQALSEYSPNTFSPTDAHRRAKSAFWAHFFQTGNIPPSTIDIATAARFSGFNEVSQWWEIPGFQEWFSNGEEFRQRVEYLSNAALDVLQGILSDQGARTGDRLQAAKMALEIAAKFPKANSSQGKSMDAEIESMSKDQLEKLISDKVRILGISKDIDNRAESSDTTTEVTD